MFLLGGVLLSTVSVYAVTYFPSNQVTYDNSSSKLNSTNVQGAIDELYSTCSKAVSSGKYMYYAVANYSYDGVSSVPYSGTLVRCNADGNSCTSIASVSRYQYINSVYATDEYMYYTVANHSYDGVSSAPYSGTLVRCNADGNSCTNITSVSNFKNIIF